MSDKKFSSADKVRAEMAPYNVIFAQREQQRGWFADCACGASHRASYPVAHPNSIILANFEKAGWLLHRNRLPLCPECQEDKMMNPTKPIPQIAPDPKIARKIFALLDEHFDDKTRAYASGWSDERAAKELDVSLEIVIGIRRTAYGELAVDPAISKLGEDILLARMEFDEVIGNITKTFTEKFNELDRQIAMMRAKKKAV